MKTFLYTILLFSGLAFISSCSSKLAVVQERVFYPQETDTARIQYLTSFSNSMDLAGKQSAFKSSIVGKQEVQIISKPYGVSIKHGKIYVCDVTLRGLEIIDLENKTLEHFIPQGRHGFELPLNSFVDDDGNLYVVDTKKNKVIVFNSKLKFLAEFGSQSLINPTDIFIKGNKIYVISLKNNRVNIYHKESKELLDYFPKTVVGNEDWLYTPTNIFIANNNIYISDMGDTKIKIYSLKGEFIKSIGSLGKAFGQFVRPKGIAADKEGNIYVVDGAFENVQIFNAEGKLLLSFGGSYQDHGDMYLPTQVTIDYDNLSYFQKYVDPRYRLKYLILVANQFGPDKISVYGRVELKK